MAKKAARGRETGERNQEQGHGQGQRRTLTPKARPVIDVLTFVALAANPRGHRKGAQGRRRVSRQIENQGGLNLVSPGAALCEVFWPVIRRSPARKGRGRTPRLLLVAHDPAVYTLKLKGWVSSRGGGAWPRREDSRVLGPLVLVCVGTHDPSHPTIPLGTCEDFRRSLGVRRCPMRGNTTVLLTCGMLAALLVGCGKTSQNQPGAKDSGVTAGSGGNILSTTATGGAAATGGTTGTGGAVASGGTAGASTKTAPGGTGGGQGGTTSGTATLVGTGGKTSVGGQGGTTISTTAQGGYGGTMTVTGTGVTCAYDAPAAAAGCTCTGASCACPESADPTAGTTCSFDCNSQDQACKFSCPNSGCTTECAPNTNCSTDCKGAMGSCQTTCNQGATCNLDCTETGGCTMPCKGGKCSIPSCLGGCDLDCSGTDASCHLGTCDGGCRITACADGNHCDIGHCSGGCAMNCGGTNAVCRFEECSGGGCSIDECGPGSTCSFGTCQIACFINHCSAGSTCVIETCLSKPCNIQCATGATCTIRNCPTGGCTIGCQQGATCTIERCVSSPDAPCDAHAEYVPPTTSP